MRKMGEFDVKNENQILEMKIDNNLREREREREKINKRQLKNMRTILTDNCQTFSFNNKNENENSSMRKTQKRRKERIWNEKKTRRKN